jgi:hypothetical protein
MDQPVPERDAQSTTDEPPALRVSEEEARQEKWRLYVLAALVLAFGALGGMHMTWLGRATGLGALQVGPLEGSPFKVRGGPS